MSKQTFTATALAGAFAAWVVLRAGGSPVDVNQPAGAPPAPGASKAALALAGTTSCSARGCHGGLAPVSDPAAGQPVLQDEYSRWLVNDPHARAYAVLGEPLSRQISTFLYGHPNAHTEARCLACHTNPAAARGEHAERFFGVGCEACHGNAQGTYLTEHTSAAWKKLTPQEKAAKGLTNVRDGSALAANCAGCHIGAPATDAHGNIVRDMNHDLIAAGHPRLNFEFGTFLANLPPHWNEVYSARQPRDDAQSWAVGQLTSAEAALDLLVNRAGHGRTDFPAPWPEFAEYDCYACHHNLQGESWRQKERKYGKHEPGALPWGTWYFPLAEKLAPEAHEPLAKLAQEMGKPLPNVDAVKQHAAAAKAALAKARPGLKLDDAGLRRDLKSWLQDSAKLPQTWDAAEQLFLASQSLKQPPAEAKLLQMRAYPQGQNSPAAEFRPEALYKLLSKGLEK